MSARSEKLWTPANVVTLARICLVPVFVVALLGPWPAYLPFSDAAEAAKPWVAAGVFGLLAATDGLDGYLARSRGEVTDFGKFVDPLADKILVAAALLALIELDMLPSWPALVILSREFIVSGIRMVAASKGEVIAASWYGKAKTVMQIIAIVLFIVKGGIAMIDPQGALHDPLYLVAWAFMLAAVALTLISMLDYLAKARHLLGLGSKRAVAEAVPADAPAERTSLADDGLCEGARAVIERARAAGLTLGTAESLTGGLIAGALTDVPGSSAVVRGGIVSYVNEVKRDRLGVPQEVLDEHGAVSERTALSMARGARKALGCDIAVSATGIAGPGGAEEGKPVGTVWLGVAGPGGARATRCLFAGDRAQVRLQAVNTALKLLSGALDDAQALR